MKKARIDQMVKGWFIGDFEPTLHRTGAVEVAMKSYRAGDAEAAHYHRVATEFTVISSGEVEMNGERFGPGDIVVVEPGEAADFRAVTDAVTLVVKIPGARDDKYPAAARPDQAP